MKICKECSFEDRNGHSPICSLDEETKCEAKYGDKECDNKATTIGGTGGEMKELCKECAKFVRKQNKANQ